MVLRFGGEGCQYAFVMTQGVGNGPSHRQPISRIADKHSATRSSGNVAPASEDRIIGRSPRFAGVAANVETLAPGERPTLRWVRFRTLGCYPLTGAIPSRADTVGAILAEMRSATTSERQGRVIDHDQAGSMELKKQEGYF